MDIRRELIIRKGKTVVNSRILEPGRYVVGTGDVDIVVDDLEVVSRHVRIDLSEAGLILEDLSDGAGLFVNGERIREPTKLLPAQLVHLGAAIEMEARLVSSESDPEQTLPPTAAAVRRLLPESFFRREKYAVGEVVAEGGMGVILEAQELVTGRTVAMKIMRRSGNTGEELFRFIEEAKITALLEHPNIVPVHELGLDEREQVYYTMKFVQGATLAEVLGRLGRNDREAVRTYSLTQLVTVLQKVCDAVAFAHSRGVIHRDLKPANVMLGPFGEVLVMDWGLAKLLPGESARTGSVSRDGMSQKSLRARAPESEFATLDGALIGTPHFMSPEQASGEIHELDERSDIYALGAILYNILTLRPPFYGQRVEEILENVRGGKLEGPVQAAKRTLDSEGNALPHLPGGRVPDSLAAVAMRALSIKRQDRYQTVAEFQKEMVSYQTGFATLAEQATFTKQIALAVRRHRREAAVLAGCVTLLIVMGVVALVNVTTERTRAEDAFSSLKSAAPVFADQARVLASSEQFDEALEKLDYALVLRPDSVDYLLEKADLLESQSRFAAAAEAYDAVVRVEPGHTRAANHVQLCRQILESPAPAPIPRVLLLKVVSAMVQEQRPVAQIVSMAMTLGVERSIAERLRPRSAGQLTLDLIDSQVSQLNALSGFPLTGLNLAGCRNITSIEFVRHLPLRSLNLEGTSVSDLSPLASLPWLANLNLGGTPVADLSPIEHLLLSTLDLTEVAASSFEALRSLPLETLILDQSNIQDLAILHSMPLRVVSLSGCRRIRNVAILSTLANLETLCLPADFYQWPGSELLAIDALRQHRPLQRIAIVPLHRASAEAADSKELFWSEWDHDLRWIRTLHAREFSFAAKKLEDGTWDLVLREQPIADLEVLRGAKLRRLDLFDTPVTDLAPLSGMPLEVLDLRKSDVADLSPLKGLPLRELYLWYNKTTDFSVLPELPDLEVFDASETLLEDLRLVPMRNLRLLRIGNTRVRDLTPLAGSRLEKIHFDNVEVEDVSPLASCRELKWIVLNDAARNVGSLRKLPNLQRISNTWNSESEPAQTAAEFWRLYDQPQAQPATSNPGRK